MKMKKDHDVQNRRAVDEHRSGKFGYFGCTPSFLQWLNSPWVFLILIVLGVIGNSKFILVN
jgi:hypothetical protein